VTDLIYLDNAAWILNQPTGIAIYDFDFRRHFPCQQPWKRSGEVTAVSRCGAFVDYAASYNQLLQDSVRLIHTPEQHQLASELAAWYPLIENITPRSVLYPHRPTAAQVAKDFDFPVFVKGSRQTSRHQKALAIVDSRSGFDEVMSHYAADPILRWQSVVVRELIRLRHVESATDDRISSSFEFRTFWWHGQCVGAGRYWWEGRRYDWSTGERAAGLAIAQQAAKQAGVPFLVVDIAMTQAGEWIVIECNDGQESGYAGVSPIGLWQAVIDLTGTSGG